jgi:hypothetical protein
MRGLLKVIAVNVIMIVALLIIVELVLDFRYFSAQTKEVHKVEYIRRLNDALVDRNVYPEDSYTLNVIKLRKDNYRLVTNRDGLILGPTQYENSDDIKTCDILFMGGSTTECLFVSDSMRFPFRTAQLLSDQLKTKIVSLNAGRSGNNTFHAISNLLHTGLLYKPKVVVYMENINDLALLSKTGSYFNAPPTRTLKKNYSTNRPTYAEHLFQEYLPSLDRRFQSMMLTLKKNSGKQEDTPDEFRGYRSGKVAEEVIMQEFERSLKTMHAMCTANGIRLVMMTQFNRLDSQNSKFLSDINKHSGINELIEWIPTYIKMNQLIRDYCQRNGLDCIDLDKAIPRTDQFIYDQVHVNDAGSALASEEITRYFLSSPSLMGLLQR